MSVIRFFGLSVLLMILSFTGIACNQLTANPQEEGRRIAEEFVKKEATFKFDGLPTTLKTTVTTAADDGWQYTVEFDSAHAGYGDRTGQVLAPVITRHTCKITIVKERVTAALMDGAWDMINQRFDLEIKPAPIEEVRTYIMKSNPPQVGVHIRGGLPDGITTFHDLQVTREGNTVNISVTVQRPRGVFGPAIYTTFEKDVNLGSDFAMGTDYTLNVNDYATTFSLSGSSTAADGVGFAIYLTRDDVPPEKMEALSHVAIADQPMIATSDIITYNAQTHELKLTDAAFERITRLPVPTSGRSFLVCVDHAPVYWGAFWTPVSSQSFDGITIWKPLGAVEPKIITIELGYPSTSFYGGEDPRNNPAVIEALDRAGKLINKLTVADVTALPNSMKGYELYSWQEGGEWQFTLITGTNRTKTIAEITAGADFISESGWVKISVEGAEAIKDVLCRLPDGEPVFWCGALHLGEATGADVALALPPADTVRAIRDYAASCGLEFSVSVG